MKLNLTFKQKAVVTAAATLTPLSLFALVTSTYFITPSVFPLFENEKDSVASRLSFTLQIDILFVIPIYLSCIIRVGNYRFVSPEDIDGSGLTEGSKQVKILRAVLQNTLEQSFLAIFTHLAYAVVMPLEYVPGPLLVAAILFFLGRIMFIKGYLYGTPGRAPGFVLTMNPTIMLLVATILTVIVDNIK